MKRVVIVLAFVVAASTLALGQGGKVEESIKKESGTSGHGMTAAEQTSQSSGGTVEEEMKALQGQLRQATLKGDTSFFEKYWADDYVAIHGDGKLSTKAQEIENFKSGAVKYESIEVREAKIRTYGDTVVTIWLGSVKATINGKPYSGDFRTTRVWVKQKGNWKIVVFQVTRVAPASQ